MKISENFDDSEFFKPDTYHSIISSNIQPYWLLDRRLIQQLQIIRDWAKKPVTVNRAFSTEAENIAVGGAKWSQHRWGRACDFSIDGLSSDEIAKFIVTNFKDGAYGKITDKDVHMDVRNSETLIEIKY